MQILEEGKELNIIIIAPELVPECARLYYGVQNNAQYAECDIYGKQLMTLNCIRNSNELYGFFLSQKLKIKIAKNILSTSFVAYDIFKTNKTQKNLTNIFMKLKRYFINMDVLFQVKNPV